MLQWQNLIQLQCPNSVVTQRLVLSQTQENIVTPHISPCRARPSKAVTPVLLEKTRQWSWNSASSPIQPYDGGEWSIERSLKPSCSRRRVSLLLRRWLLRRCLLGCGFLCWRRWFSRTFCYPSWLRLAEYLLLLYNSGGLFNKLAMRRAIMVHKNIQMWEFCACWQCSLLAWGRQLSWGQELSWFQQLWREPSLVL